MPHPQCLDDAQCRLPVGGREPRVPAGSCREGAEQRRQLGRHGRAAQRRLQRAIHLDGAQKCEGRRQKCGGREHADCRYRLPGELVVTDSARTAAPPRRHAPPPHARTWKERLERCRLRQ